MAAVGDDQISCDGVEGLRGISSPPPDRLPPPVNARGTRYSNLIAHNAQQCVSTCHWNKVSEVSNDDPVGILFFSASGLACGHGAKSNTPPSV